jgi:hypothetical protein
LRLFEGSPLAFIKEVLLHDVLLSFDELALLPLLWKVKLHESAAYFLADEHFLEWGDELLVTERERTDRIQKPQTVRCECNHSWLRDPHITLGIGRECW